MAEYNTEGPFCNCKIPSIARKTNEKGYWFVCEECSKVIKDSFVLCEMCKVVRDTEHFFYIPFSHEREEMPEEDMRYCEEMNAVDEANIHLILSEEEIEEYFKNRI